MTRQGRKWRTLISLFNAVIALLLLTSCTVEISNYTHNKPHFDLFEYFSGTTRGWGIVQDRKGELLRQFVVNIEGTFNDKGQLILAETFHWNDGEISERTWFISKDDFGKLSGCAADVIGSAKGQSAGNALNWSYQVEIPVSGTNWKIHFDDWMFLQSDGVLLTRAEMRKFGFKVGEVTIAFMKTTPKES